MSTSSQLESAYVLHTRVYRDSSLLVDFFTKSEGRISAVARGVRKAKSPLKGLLQPFNPLLINWYGKGDLVTLKNVEAENKLFFLQKKSLISGLYLNELMVRLLTRHDPHAKLFAYYQQTIFALAENKNIEQILRDFELKLLDELGYGLRFDRAMCSDEPIKSELFYTFQPQKGFVIAGDDRNKFPGEHLLAINHRKFDSPDILRTAKQLMRLAILPLLAGKPLVSRMIFIN
jgi:DNA repair protein RecO (recombination protein O)